MKRCPQCDFIYNDTDEVCDLDGAKLIQVNEPELVLNEPAYVKPKPTRSNPKPILLAGIGGVVLGAILIVSYVWYTKSRQQTQGQMTTQQVQQPTPTPVTVAVTATPEPSPSPSPTVSPTSQPRVEQSKRAAVSRDPVSTSPDAKSSGPVWIKLLNGARIEADEVWRTKEGVWYRRNGVVTLIKANRIKAIEKAR